MCSVTKLIITGEARDLRKGAGACAVETLHSCDPVPEKRKARSICDGLHTGCPPR